MNFKICLFLINLTFTQINSQYFSLPEGYTVGRIGKRYNNKLDYEPSKFSINCNLMNEPCLIYHLRNLLEKEKFNQHEDLSAKAVQYQDSSDEDNQGVSLRTIILKNYLTGLSNKDLQEKILSRNDLSP